MRIVAKISFEKNVDKSFFMYCRKQDKSNYISKYKKVEKICSSKNLNIAIVDT